MWLLVEQASLVAVATLTISKSKLFAGVREWASEKAPQSLGSLLSCPYCLSHWIAAAVAIGAEGISWDSVRLSAILIALSAPLMALVKRSINGLED